MKPGRKRRAARSGIPVHGSREPHGDGTRARHLIWPVWLLIILGTISVVAFGFIAFNKSRQQASGLPQAKPTGPSAANTPGSVSSASFNPTSSTNHVGHSADEGDGTDTEKAVGLISLGNERLREGRLEEAIAYFSHSLLHEPGAEDAHYNLGIALARAGRTEDAIQHYLEALRILPDYAEVHNNLGNLLVKQGKFDEAIEHFKQSIELNPESSSTYNNLGTALARQGKVSEATVQFAKAVQLLPSYVDAHYNLGNAYIAQGRVEEAISEYKEALKLQPDFRPAMTALGKARQKASEVRK